MQLVRSLRSGLVLAAVILGLPVGSPAACDVAGEDAADLEATYAAIDTLCPCGVASRALYLACAHDAVASRIAGGFLDAECKRDAFRFARHSRCGKEGAVACCRINRNGLERHRVARSAFHCVAPSGGTACVSEQNSIVTGCDPSGCVPLPYCGNGVVDPGEQCDPPDDITCDDTCQELVCGDPPPGLCGNGALDPEEGCEPPGTATCDRFCQPAPCGAPPVGERTLACLEATAEVAAASNGESVLVAWGARLHHEGADVLVRRVDPDGVPLDPGPTALSEGLQCVASDSGLAVASDGSDYAVSWYTQGSVPAIPFFTTESIYARGVGGGGAPTGAAALIVSAIPIGMCRTLPSGPTAIAPADGPFAVVYRQIAGCAGGPIFQTPVGTLVPLPASAPLVDFSLDPISAPPAFFAEGPAAVDSLGTDAFAAWPSTAVANASPPFDTAPVMRGGWIESSGARSLLTLRFARWTSGLAPDVAAGTASLLVAWAARADDAATTATEIRGLRVTRAAGALDPDFGLLLATSATRITRGPAAAFDGAVWVVAWVEESAGGHDVKAVAVGADGTVLDASPRLLAAGVSDAAPALASAGDGSVIVAFERAGAGGAVALNTIRADRS